MSFLLLVGLYLSWFVELFGPFKTAALCTAELVLLETLLSVDEISYFQSHSAILQTVLSLFFVVVFDIFAE